MDQGRVEVRIRKKVLAVGEACVAIIILTYCRL